MKADKVEVGQRAYTAGIPGQAMLRDASNVTDLLQLCADHQTDAVLLYEENLPSGFFDLRSRQAGEILQKLRNYRVRLAVVLSTDHATEGRFAEMVSEESRGSHFAVFTNEREAQRWVLNLPQ